ncbi:MAG TPA: DUF1343 domain-containing protein [Lentisphaeria bacterium]|nr:DUF1343 domain-containing protein [Lentisphaeria bacterium]
MKNKTILSARHVVTILLVFYLFSFRSYCGDKVKLGIDNIDSYLKVFEGKRVGLITNQTGLNSEFVPTIDILKAKTELKALYCPEHGIRGDAGPGDNVDSYTDSKSGLPVYSLYKNGTGIPPAKEDIEGIDILAYDVQDVGARFYTYISTMYQSMKACKKYDKEFIVFDRPDPISGNIVEGGITGRDYVSFVGIAPIPGRYGLTCGELAKYLNDSMKIGCKLTVIPMNNWKRNMFWQNTKLLWIPTSPNIPTAETAIVYAGTCFFEGTNLSVGRGTAMPFLQIGAPWIKDPEKLADGMNKLQLNGVKFRGLYFAPLADMYKGELCGGIGICVTDRKNFRAVEVAVKLLFKIRELYNNKFEFRSPAKDGRYWIDLLTGSSMLRTSDSAEKVLRDWKVQSEEFKNKTKKYYIYQ